MIRQMSPLSLACASKKSFYSLSYTYFPTTPTRASDKGDIARKAREIASFTDATPLNHGAAACDNPAQGVVL